jgi:hypothetical protein
MNFQVLRTKSVNWKTIILIVVFLFAIWGIYQAGMRTGDWLVNYLGIDQISAQPLK